VSSVVGILFLVAMLVGCSGWLFYAYRNPHTPSGQCFIRVNTYYFFFNSLIQLFFPSHFSIGPRSGDGDLARHIIQPLLFTCKNQQTQFVYIQWPCIFGSP
jgi:hypothetical protein